MRTPALLLAIYLLLVQDPPVRSEFGVDRICGYGTARCRRRCRTQEHNIGKCRNTHKCCLRTWASFLSNAKF